MSNEERLSKQYEIARDLHNHVESQATLAVMKSTLLLAAHALLCTAYIQVAFKLKLFAHITYSNPDRLFIVSGLLILSAFLVSLVSIWPKLKSTSDGRLMFFAGIRRYSKASDYVNEYNKTSEALLKSMLLSSIYGKSVWLYRTFMAIRIAICCSALGTFLCVIAVWLISLPDYPSLTPAWLLGGLIQ
ncbi:Pycsar system effector family protein [Pseudomonas vancouverensis]|uniref:Pycsar system effector family protein n=1 Tax=Pseudomonas vancouverensis TaxID=95300 RepID=UPI003D0260D5